MNIIEFIQILNKDHLLTLLLAVALIGVAYILIEEKWEGRNDKTNE